MSENTLSALRKAIRQAWLADEAASIEQLLSMVQDYDPVATGEVARSLVTAIRKKSQQQSLVEVFLHEYQLDSEEGIVLLGIAEALLRIPDTLTQERFLQEKLGSADWNKHLQQSDSLLVNLSTRALSLTGQYTQHCLHAQQRQQIFERLLTRMGLPLVRTALKQAMQRLACQFVIAEQIGPALEMARKRPQYRYSFDMLGEAALTASDAEKYYQAYLHAIEQLAQQAASGDIHDNPGISIKLSALCPRYEPAQHQHAVPEIVAKLLQLAKLARSAGITVTIDAEESERLAMSLEVFSRVYSNPVLTGWSGLGLAVQAYQKRALPVLQWLAALAAAQRRKIPLRLVKGAYWDTEIKKTQENGLLNYPVFTHKSATDSAYLACAAFILDNDQAFFPQFATHNAHTVAAIHALGRQHPGYEFQRLHGMGDALYREIVEVRNWSVPCRIYAPVGCFQELLPYLVRRLLENGANTSFINRLENPDFSIAELTEDPLQQYRKITRKAAHIVLPAHLYGEQRLNSAGLNLNDIDQLQSLQQELDSLAGKTWQAFPLIDAEPVSGREHAVYNPANDLQQVGSCVFADRESISRALASASEAAAEWRQYPVQKRADCLLAAADLLEAERLELASLAIREGGKTIRDSLSEIREAVDFCRYYAQSALTLLEQPLQLPGPTGEENLLYQYGRGVFACISPWNFPIAIFMGQITAALAAGNTVLAKPASATPLTAFRCVQLLHQAGIPENVLHFLPADAGSISDTLFSDARICGVAFTGSTATAHSINLRLARQQQKIIPLIAETGGQNVMIADSSAYPQQLVKDVVQSAFNNAGQRCSALRVLFLQQEIAEPVIAMLIGAMQQLRIGDPGCYSTDIGPLIDAAAVKSVATHVQRLRESGNFVYQLPLDEKHCAAGFFAPCLIELAALQQLQREVFGPVLHIIRYRATDLEQVIDAINGTGYGLTLGIHSRIDANIETIRTRAMVGNIYVNRNMIGAVVGAQPFGGMGLSGTGPKAGGPDYLRRFAVEQTVTTNTAAVGGNTSLLAGNPS